VAIVALPFVVVFFITYALPFLASTLQHAPAYKSITEAVSFLWNVLCVVFYVGVGLAAGYVLLLATKKASEAFMKLSEVRRHWLETSLLKSEWVMHDVGDNGSIPFNRLKGTIGQKLLAPAMPRGSKEYAVTEVHIPPLLELLKTGEGLSKDDSPYKRSIPVGIDASNKLLSYRQSDETSGICTGEAGSGKTVFMKGRVIIALWNLGNVTIIDPHYADMNSEQSLIGDLGSIAELCTCIGFEQDETRDKANTLAAQKGKKQTIPHTPVLDTVAAFIQELDAREAGRSQERVLVGDKLEWIPRYLVIDELPEIIGWGKAYEPLAKLLGSTGRRGRKFQMHVLLATQALQAEFLGGTQVRQALPSQYILASSEQTVSLLVGNGRRAKKVLQECAELLPGTLFYKGLKHKYVQLSGFNVEPDDMQEIYTLLCQRRGQPYALLTQERTTDKLSTVSMHELPTEKLPHDLTEESIEGEIVGDVLTPFPLDAYRRKQERSSQASDTSEPSLTPVQKSTKQRATLNDAIAVWNEQKGSIGRYRLQELLQKRELECSEDAAKGFMRSIKQLLDNVGGVAGGQE